MILIVLVSNIIDSIKWSEGKQLGGYIYICCITLAPSLPLLTGFAIGIKLVWLEREWQPYPVEPVCFMWTLNNRLWLLILAGWYRYWELILLRPWNEGSENKLVVTCSHAVLWWCLASLYCMAFCLVVWLMFLDIIFMLFTSPFGHVPSQATYIVKLLDCLS